MAVLGEAPLDVEQANWRALDGRMMSGINAPRPPRQDSRRGPRTTTRSPDYREHGFFDGNGNLNTVAVGGDMKLSDRLLAGVQFGYSRRQGRLRQRGGSFKLHEPMGTFYRLRRGPWYVGAHARRRQPRLLDITRTSSSARPRAPKRGTANGYQTSPACSAATGSS